MQEEISIVQYEIDKILEEEIIDGKPHYLVKWKGFSATQSTWEPIENLIQAIDIVHNWKQQRCSHTKHYQHLNKPKHYNKKTKKINSDNKGHVLSDQKLQRKIKNSKIESMGQKKKLNSVLLEESFEESTRYGEMSSSIYSDDRLHFRTASGSYESCQSNRNGCVQQKIQQLRYPHKNSSDRSEAWLKNKAKRLNSQTVDKYISRLDNEIISSSDKKKSKSKSKSKNQEQSQVSGFKVVGKITKQGIRKILWYFDWQGQKICEVQLQDGTKANMRRDDIMRICPDKLCDYLQKVVDMKH